MGRSSVYWLSWPTLEAFVIILCLPFFLSDCGSGKLQEVTKERSVQHAIQITYLLFGGDFQGRVFTTPIEEIHEICGKNSIHCFRNNPPGNEYLLITDGVENHLCEETMLTLMGLYVNGSPRNVFGKPLDPVTIAESWCNTFN